MREICELVAIQPPNNKRKHVMKEEMVEIWEKEILDEASYGRLQGVPLSPWALGLQMLSCFAVAHLQVFQ